MGDFIHEIKARRVLPAVGVYAGGCWVLIEILDRLVERYLLSPNITDAAFWGLYSLIPAVVLVAWSHGKPGKDRATVAEKVGVPINVIASLGLLVTVFGGKDLSATANMITVANEQGVQETHYVPSESYRRRMAVFFFDNDSGNPELDWLRYGVTELLVQDLQQSPFVLANSPWSNFSDGFYARMRRSGFEDGLGIPRSLMRAIAEDANRQYFVEGEFGRAGAEYSVTARIWETATLREVAEITESGFDLYGVVDRISREVHEALKIPESSPRIAEDLPLAETYGESEAAFRHYIEGLNARLFDNDFQRSNDLMDRALETDPNFVLAWFLKAINGVDAGDLGGAQEAIRGAQALDYRLPANDRNNLKWIGYRLAGENDKAIAFLRLQVKLRNDAASHLRLATLLMMTGAMEESRLEFEKSLEKDPMNVAVYQHLASIERALGNRESAIAYARRYQKEKPEDVESSLLLGDLLRDGGDPGGAEEYYLQASLLSDQAITPLLRLSDMAARRGNANAARGLLEQAEAMAGDPAQLGSVRQYACQLEFRLGRVHAAIEHLRMQGEYMSQTLSGFEVAMATEAPMSRMYLEVGDLENAERVLRKAEQAVQPPLNQFLGFNESELLLAKGDIEGAREALDRAEAVVEQFEMEPLRFLVAQGEAQIREQLGDRAGHVEKLEETLARLDQAAVAGETGNLMPLLFADLAESLVLAGDLEAAGSALEKGFRLDAAEPTLWVSRARYQWASGLKQLALASLGYALAIWQDADPEYRDFAEALELQSRYRGSL